MEKKLTLIIGIAALAAVIVAAAAFVVYDGKNNNFDQADNESVTVDASEMANGFLSAYSGEYVSNLLNPINGEPIPDFTVTVISDKEAEASTDSPMGNYLGALFCRYTVCESHDAAMEKYNGCKEWCEGKAGTVTQDAIYYYAIEAKGSFPEACGVYGDSPTGSFMMGPWVLVYYSAVYKNVFVNSTFFVGGKNYEETDFSAVIDAMYKGITDPVPIDPTEELIDTDASEMANGFLSAYSGEYVSNLLNPTNEEPIPDFSLTVISDKEAEASTDSPMPSYLNALFCRYTVCESHDAAMEKYNVCKESNEKKDGTNIMSAIYYHAIETKGSFSEAYGVYGDSPAKSFMKGPWVIVYYSAVYKNVFVDSAFFISSKNYEETDFSAVIDAMFKGITDPVPVVPENEALGICCSTNITADDEASAMFTWPSTSKREFETLN